MISAKEAPVADERDSSEKADWIPSRVTQFDPGDAEASDGPGPDGGLAS